MSPAKLPRLRQAVVAATELDPVVERLKQALDLGEPYNDPGVSYFGLCNAVFAIGDQFLEVVSPVQDNTAAGRLIERRGGDCGYMLMFQVEDLAAARERAAEAGVREVFAVELDEIEELHLHPADMQGAIVALSTPKPPQAWRWGGAGWEQRAAPGAITSVTVAVTDPDAVAARWRHVIGGPAGIEFVSDDAARGPISMSLKAPPAHTQLPADVAGVRFERS
ncbi:MAG TPA: VOC family protein [Solirubrobacteraceae bacterium]|nr:VOC family protein [Solirubrobacteraceae bacterium]